MVALIILIVISSLIFWLQRKTWRLEKNIVFPIVTAVFYFWSLSGSWLFCLDKITGIGEAIGLKYYYLMDKMFKVELDGTYYLVILLYGLFICTYQLVCLRFLKKKMVVKPDDSAADKRTVKLTSLPIVLVAIFCLIGSFTSTLIGQ
jgi:Na+/H+ antiporter NhaD/arsenite permease-like protein